MSKTQTTSDPDEMDGYIPTLSLCSGRGTVVMMEETPRVCPYCESAHCLEKQL